MYLGRWKVCTTLTSQHPNEAPFVLIPTPGIRNYYNDVDLPHNFHIFCLECTLREVPSPTDVDCAALYSGQKKKLNGLGVANKLFPIIVRLSFCQNCMVPKIIYQLQQGKNILILQAR